MKVLHLLRALRVGGLEEVVVNLVNGLSARGVECHVGCLLEEGPWRSRVRDQGLWIGRLEEQGRLRCVLSLATYLRRNGIQLLHTHNSQAHLFGVAAHCLTGVPVIHTKHGQNWPGDRWWVWKSRQASRLTRKIVAVSEDIARIVVDIERVPRRKVSVILNGIDTARFVAVDPARARHDSRKRLGVSEDAFVVGSVGRLAWEKNYELLVQALGQLADAAPNAFMVLVGEGPYRKRIVRAIEEGGLSARCMLPGVAADVTAWLHVMDVFCLSSLTEGTSVTLLEAGAAGLPAAVTDVGGNAEVVVDGVTGIVSPSGDAGALASSLLRLRGDPALCRSMGDAAKDRIERRYSVSRSVDAYKGLYHSVLGESPAEAMLGARV